MATPRQTVRINIVSNLASGTLSVKNAQAIVGKFYSVSEDDERSIDDINEITIEPDNEAEVRACGRDSHEATEGQIDLYDGATKTCTVYWNAEFVAPIKFRIRDEDSGYTILTDSVEDSRSIRELNVQVTRD